MLTDLKSKISKENKRKEDEIIDLEQHLQFWKIKTQSLRNELKKLRNLYLEQINNDNDIDNKLRSSNNHSNPSAHNNGVSHSNCVDEDEYNKLLVELKQCKKQKDELNFALKSYKNVLENKVYNKYKYTSVNVYLMQVYTYTV